MSLISAKMKRLEQITRKFLENELRSSEFMRGIVAAIEKSEETGYETHFNVLKQLYGNHLVYPYEIEIGDKEEAGIFVGEERAEKEFIKQYGRKPKNSLELVEFMDESMLTSFPYPEVPKDKSYKSLRKGEDYYPLFDFHTHPKGICCPSLGDLEYLRDDTARCSKRYELDLRPIHIIGTKSKENSYDLFLLQERGVEFNSERDFELAFENALTFYKHKGIADIVLGFLDEFGKRKKYHNYAIAEIRNGKLKFNYPDSLKDFRFKSYENEI